MKPSVVKALTILQSGTGSIAKASATIRKEATHPEILGIFAKLESFPQKSREVLLGQIRPTDWTEIASLPRPAATNNLQRALTWHSCVHVAFHSSILKHQSIRQNFESEFILGNTEDANTHLNSHNKIFGPTLWELKWRLAVQDKMAGDQGRKQLLDVYQSKIDNGLVISIARIFNHLFEDGIPPSIIRTTISSIYENDDKIIRAFFELIAFGDWITDVPITSLLEIIEALPLIDRYVLYLKIISKALSAELADHKILERSLNRTASYVENIDLSHLASLAEDSLQQRMLLLSVSSQQIWDLYLSGDYGKVPNMLRAHLKEHSPDFSIIDLCAKSLIYSKSLDFHDTTPLGTLTHYMVQVYQRNSDYEHYLQLTDQFLLRYQFHALPSQLISYIASFGKENNPTLAKRAHLLSTEYSPRSLENFATLGQSQLYLNQLAASNPHFCGAAYFAKIAAGPENEPRPETIEIPRVRTAFFQGYYCYRSRNFSKALEYITEFLTLQEKERSHPLAPFAVAEAKLLLVCIYERLGDALSAQSALVNFYLEHPNNLKTDLLDRIYSISQQQKQTTSSAVDFPLLASIAGENPHTVCIALKRYMKWHDVVVPSQLIPRDNLPEKENKMAYFFLRICSTDVIDSLPQLDCQEAVEGERLKLLKWIIEECPLYARTAETEKLRIIQNAQLRSALNRISENKVVLNISSLREAEAETFGEIFSTYRSQRDLAEAQIKNELTSALERLSLSRSRIVMLGLNDTEPIIRKAFINAFRLIREKFLTSPHFGIEACLSGKIRHGILVEHLLKPLKSRHLFVPKDKAQRDEAVNYWRACHVGGNTESFDKALTVLEELTTTVACLAREVKDKWIQTRIEDGDCMRLFDYSYEDKELKTIHQQISNEESDINRFLDICFLALSERTQSNLKTIRKKIRDSLVPVMEGAFNDALRKFHDIPEIQAIRTALIGAKQDAETACEEMKRWFENASGALATDVDLNLVGATVIGMVERLHPDLKERHILEVTSDFRVKGQFFDALVHLLFFLLENGVKHMSVAHSNYTCVVKIRAVSNSLTIEVWNPCASSDDAKSAADKINSRIGELKTNLDPKRIIREGGSGFAKIVATVIYEFGHPMPLISANQDDAQICTKVETRMEGLIV